MFTHLDFLRNEKLFARIIADRDEMIEGLIMQVDQLRSQLQKDAEPKEPPCPKP